MFPFPPPQMGSGLVPYESKPIAPEVRSGESRCPSTGLFTFAFETRTDRARDQRIFQIEEHDGKWRISSAWQAEGSGKLPFVAQIFRAHPDIMNKAANTLLYQFDGIVERLLNFTDRVIERLLPYDGRDVE